MRHIFFLLSCLCVLTGLVGNAHSQESQHNNEFITLGTTGGPIPHATRSQPANVLLVDDVAYLVDVGDGTAGRLAAAGITLHAIRGIFISHLHYDHTGGLAAMLSLRYQTSSPHPIVIYGPVGTQKTVDAVIDFMRPSEVAYGLPGTEQTPPEHNIEVREITDGSVIKLPHLSVTSAENTHYTYSADSPAWEYHESLSYRFDLPNRSIVYTGDTGPSSAVEELARDADILVSEMMDPTVSSDKISRNNPDIPPKKLAAVLEHIKRHHVTTDQVGQMARSANVKKVVITHLDPGPGPLLPEKAKQYISEIKKRFDGDVVIANDLDRF